MNKRLNINENIKPIIDLFRYCYYIFLLLSTLTCLFILSYIYLLWNALPELILFIITFVIIGQILYSWKFFLGIFFRDKKLLNMNEKDKDKHVKKLIMQASSKEGFKTLISPWPLADAFFMFYQIICLFFAIKKNYSSRIGIKNSFILMGELFAAVSFAFHSEKYDDMIQDGIIGVLGSIPGVVGNAMKNKSSEYISKFGIEAGKAISNMTFVAFIGFSIHKILKNNSSTQDFKRIIKKSKWNARGCVGQIMVWELPKKLIKMGFKPLAKIVKKGGGSLNKEIKKESCYE